MKTFEKFRQDLTLAEAKGDELDCFSCHKCSHEWQAPARKAVDAPEPHCPRCGEQGYYTGYMMDEDAPTNNAGGGNVAGIGVGPQGEPGVTPNYQRKRKQLKLMNGPAVDPRLFADAIFSRKKPTK